jgi:hypothetical protein
VLQGIADHRDAIWPTHPPVYIPRAIAMPSDGEEGLFRVFDVPGLQAFRQRHPDITPSIPLKAALALFLMKRTGQNRALFGQVEAGRGTWPFLPASLGTIPISIF